jgi:FkbM family methyltransferase
MHLTRYSIGERLVLSVPHGLKRTHVFLDSFQRKGVSLSKNGNKLLLEHTLNDKLIKTIIEKDSSDALVFEQVMMRHEYEYILDIFRKHNLTCSVMIDAGANIGLTSIYFKSFYPDAKIIALEPSSGTFDRMETNIKINDLSNTTALKMGLWGRNTHLKPDHSFRGGLDWSFRLVETDAAQGDAIQVVSMPWLIDHYQLSSIDFLKIDIEGGESSVLNEDSELEWLSKVNVVAVEIHDEFGFRERIERLLQQKGFDLSHSEELTVGVNRRILG